MLGRWILSVLHGGCSADGAQTLCLTEVWGHGAALPPLHTAGSSRLPMASHAAPPPSSLKGPPESSSGARGGPWGQRWDPGSWRRHVHTGLVLDAAQKLAGDRLPPLPESLSKQLLKWHHQVKKGSVWGLVCLDTPCQDPEQLASQEGRHPLLKIVLLKEGSGINTSGIQS